MTRAADKIPKVGVVGIIARGSRLLIIRRSATVLSPLTWAFPGGAIEEGESETEALVREMREELGVSAEPVRRCWTYERRSPPLLLHCWDAVIGDQALHPDPAEVADYRWLTPEEIRVWPGTLPSCVEFLDTLSRS